MKSIYSWTELKKRRSRFTFAAIVAVAFAGMHLSSGAGADGISEIAGRPVDTGLVPGVLVGIWTGKSEPVIIARGVSDIPTGAPIKRANSQRIGSITKSMTITRILQLADDGRLSLDDPIDRYVPNLRNGSATLRELANMTSGIFNYTEDLPFVLDFATHPAKPWTDRKLVAVANHHRPYFSPGRRWHYSNTNTILLGMVVERITGRPLRTELARSIFKPLDLSRTIYPTGVFLPNPHSHGYTVLDDDVGLVDVTEVTPSAFSGAGAVVSTLDDLHVWGRALALGSLISRRAQAQRLEMVPSANGIGPFYDRYGLGIGTIDGWLGHTADLFGFQSLVMHNIIAKTTVVILVNASTREHVPTKMFQEMTPLLPRARPQRRPEVRIFGKRNRIAGATPFPVKGSSGGGAGILLVEYSVDGGPWQTARGASSWRFNATLHPGLNQIRARATDRMGAKSRVAKIQVTR